jgi:3-deoxy-D-manno-octulosonate 8-phosphate phosphatase (KDO 8-P phosphatase)
MEQVKLIVLDVDGTLTDGVIDLDDEGRERKRFHIHDGLGIVMAQAAGLEVAVITARRSTATEHRLRALGVTEIIQAAGDKAASLRALMERRRLQPSEVAFVGDDLTDLPAFWTAGVRIAVADGAERLRREADWVTPRAGGHGAVRDAVEEILRRQGRLEAAEEAYLAGQAARAAGGRQ